MNKSKKFSLLVLAILLAAVIVLANINVSITQGVDGRLRTITMPLYVKWIEFLSRHYEYARIAKEVTAGCRSDEDKTLAILKWTHDNIRKTPSEWPVVDDHVLNIIIRGYGVADQFQDVFTTLCAYSGLPAFYEDTYNDKKEARYPIAFVKFNNSWHAFDAYYYKYFKTNDGRIATIEDIIRDRSIIDKAIGGDMTWGGVPYRNFYYSLKPVEEGKTLRPAKQMPMNRILFEIKKAIGLEKGKAA
ncbi:MAG: transglutaminase domain-containing protein [Candidatus Omnitrophica bacterium]|nr:transglutaminase domain-containing protein [Candidatus Omnitrophota bacterium]